MGRFELDRSAPLLLSLERHLSAGVTETAIASV
jgi:hypothetical protein